MKRAIVEAIESWLSLQEPGARETGKGTKPESISTSLSSGDIIRKSELPQLSDRERKWLGQALEILRSGTQLAKSLEENLTGFSMGVDAMREVQRLRAERDERENRTVPASESAPDRLQEGIERAREKQAGIRRALEGTPGTGKGVQKKKG